MYLAPRLIKLTGVFVLFTQVGDFDQKYKKVNKKKNQVTIYNIEHLVAVLWKF